MPVSDGRPSQHISVVIFLWSPDLFAHLANKVGNPPLLKWVLAGIRSSTAKEYQTSDNCELIVSYCCCQNCMNQIGLLFSFTRMHWHAAWICQAAISSFFLPFEKSIPTWLLPKDCRESNNKLGNSFLQNRLFMVKTALLTPWFLIMVNNLNLWRSWNSCSME